MIISMRAMQSVSMYAAHDVGIMRRWVQCNLETEVARESGEVPLSVPDTGRPSSEVGKRGWINGVPAKCP